MTRETKVGLLVGMGVILLIGIIVSDQLSSIQRQDAADLTSFAGDTQESIAPLGAAEPRFDTAIDARADVLTPPGSTAPAPTRADHVEVPAEFAAPPINPAREARAESVLEQIALRTESAVPAPAIDPALVSRTTTETVIPLREPTSPVAPTTTTITTTDVPTITLDQPAVSDIIPRPSIPTSPVRSAAAPKGRTHVVAEGESMYRLAERYLGNGADWKKIADANPGKVGPEGQLVTGVELVIPGAAAPSTPITATPPKPAPTPATKPQARPEKTYTVRAGDSLFSIAKSQMGNGGAWEKLYQANRDKLKNPDQVREGMTLRIPG